MSDAIERLKSLLWGSEYQAGVGDNVSLLVKQDDARAILDHIDRLTRERDEAAARERAAVVAWLKEQWQGRLQSSVYLANQIEAGAHLLAKQPER